MYMYMYMHVQVGDKCTFWISDGNGGKKGESKTIVATHGLLKGIGREKIFQTLNMGTDFPLRVGL
jgi:hypothetical protein